MAVKTFDLYVYLEISIHEFVVGWNPVIGKMYMGLNLDNYQISKYKYYEFLSKCQLQT